MRNAAAIVSWLRRTQLIVAVTTEAIWRAVSASCGAMAAPSVLHRPVSESRSIFCAAAASLADATWSSDSTSPSRSASARISASPACPLANMPMSVSADVPNASWAAFARSRGSANSAIAVPTAANRSSGDIRSKSSTLSPSCVNAAAAVSLPACASRSRCCMRPAASAMASTLLPDCSAA